MSSEWLAFVDESGNDGMDFNQQGVSEYYVLAAIVVRTSEQQQATAAFSETKSKHFPGASEMKSDYIGDNDDRRLKVIASLANASFDIHLHLVDKRMLHGRGFRYSSSFVKYLFGELVSILLDRYTDLAIMCDRIKTATFQDDVGRYLEHQHPCSLLQKWNLGFSDSRNSVCLQAADIIAGTGRRCCSLSPKYPEQEQLLHLLSKHLSNGSFRRFPSPKDAATVDNIADHLQAYDPVLEMKAVSDAEAYSIQHAPAKEPSKAVLIRCVHELLNNNRLQHNHHWVPTRRLVAVCGEVLGEEVSPRRVRSFIGRLRDEGLLIASRRNPGGYKLPNRMADVVEFLNTQNEKIKPMMRRIQKARNALYSLSDKDILLDGGFGNLLRLLPPVGTLAESI